MAAMLWHPVPGRMQSVSVADKKNIWGVTLDQQLGKFNTDTQRWQLVSVTSEMLNQSRFSATSTSSTRSALTASNSLASMTSPPPIPESESDSTTIQVSVASDGTVVRLDKSKKAWYLIAPQNQADFEKDVIWIDLGHYWRVVRQIWGLTDTGDIYYGTSDQFVQLGPAITSGAGYEKPTLSYISVGTDDVVLATDAHSGIVFRLKTRPTSSHPPVWTALPGTGLSNGLHFLNCTLSSMEFVVGITRGGHVYRFSNSTWIPLGGGAKIDALGVGADGYVLGVDRDGDLFGCQLYSTVVIPRRKSSRALQLNRLKNVEDANVPSSPQAPNALDMSAAPRQQGASRRPMASPRELFEMSSSGIQDRLDSEGARPATAVATESKSDSPTTPSGLNISQLQRDDSLSRITVPRNASPKPISTLKSPSKGIPLRIVTRSASGRPLNSGPGSNGAGDSYFNFKAATTTGIGNDTSSPISHSVVGNPYANASHPSSADPSTHSPTSSQLDHLSPVSAKSSYSNTSRTSYNQLRNHTGDKNGYAGDKYEVQESPMAEAMSGDKSEIQEDDPELSVASPHRKPNTNKASVDGGIVDNGDRYYYQTQMNDCLRTNVTLMEEQVSEAQYQALLSGKPERGKKEGMQGVDMNVDMDMMKTPPVHSSINNNWQYANLKYDPWQSHNRRGIDNVNKAQEAMISPKGKNHSPTFASHWDASQHQPTATTAAPLVVASQAGYQQQQYLAPQQSQDRDLEYYHSTPGLSSVHRPSDTSEILMLQQQEFLRRTRLRSEPLILPIDPSTHNDNNCTTPEKSELEYYPTFPSQAQQQQEAVYQKEEFPDYPESAAFRMATINGQTPFAGNAKVGGEKNQYQQPSYSSTHLQHYLDSNLSMQSTTGSQRQRSSVEMKTYGRDSNANTNTGVNVNRGSVHGEDDQGRWVGATAATSDPPVQHFEPHKSKCCVII
ncbi:hypothetical protein BG011_004565 [Mortierella polycephala]|uniref:Uncharacterized protein n=1 Tax=Mortierella polycephala TaxID=41804 RepID=A0A9P6QCF3_9FUNG|nr:hypothetical protein BG011_004565 [Mortierella polycephala]